MAIPLDARLERVPGGACCVADLASEARALAAAPGFEARLTALKALSDRNRFLAARLLESKGEMCQCEIQGALGLTHATVNHHMRILRDAGIVEERREGKWLYYALTPQGRRAL